MLKVRIEGEYRKGLSMSYICWLIILDDFESEIFDT